MPGGLYLAYVSLRFSVGMNKTGFLGGSCRFIAIDWQKENLFLGELK